MLGSYCNEVMKIKQRIFIFCLISLIAIYVTWMHAYDVFYNGFESKIFGGDSVTYLNLGFNKQTLLNILSNFGYLGATPEISSWALHRQESMLSILWDLGTDLGAFLFHIAVNVLI